MNALQSHLWWALAFIQASTERFAEWLEYRAQERTLALIARIERWRIEGHCHMAGCAEPKDLPGHARHSHFEPHPQHEEREGCWACNRERSEKALGARPPPTPMPGPGRKVWQ